MRAPLARLFGKGFFSMLYLTSGGVTHRDPGTFPGGP